MYVFDGKNLISIFGIPYFPVLPSDLDKEVWTRWGAVQKLLEIVFFWVLGTFNMSVFMVLGYSRYSRVQICTCQVKTHQEQFLCSESSFLVARNQGFSTDIKQLLKKIGWQNSDWCVLCKRAWECRSWSNIFEQESGCPFAYCELTAALL